MSLQTNNFLIAAFVVLTLLVAVTIWLLATSGIHNEYVEYFWSILVISWFLSLLYGPFARLTSQVLPSGLAKSSAGRTLKDEQVMSAFKFLRIWVEPKN